MLFNILKTTNHRTIEKNLLFKIFRKKATKNVYTPSTRNFSTDVYEYKKKTINVYLRH